MPSRGGIVVDVTVSLGVSDGEVWILMDDDGELAGCKAVPELEGVEVILGLGLSTISWTLETLSTALQLNIRLRPGPFKCLMLPCRDTRHRPKVHSGSEPL